MTKVRLVVNLKVLSQFKIRRPDAIQPSLRDCARFLNLPSTACWATFSRPGDAGTLTISGPCLGQVL
jgi:hypothetical protein